MKKGIAMLLVLVLALSVGAFAEKRTESEGYRLPDIQVRPAPTDDATPAPETTPEATPAPETTPAPEQPETTPEPTPGIAVSAVVVLEDESSSLNVRAAADAAAEVVGYLQHGDNVTVTGYVGDWAAIAAADGLTGYVMSSFLSESEIPVLPPEPTIEPADPLEGLRPITVVLREGETELPLYAAADATSEVLALIPAGGMLYVKEIEAEWSYAVYGESEGYVLTEKIALYNAPETTPEEEEIIRTVTVTSSLDGMAEVYEGTLVTLTAALTGFENDEYAIGWQYTPDGGETVCDVEGADGLSCSFPITEENVDYLWRICITLKGEQPETAEPIE